MLAEAFQVGCVICPQHCWGAADHEGDYVHALSRLVVCRRCLCCPSSACTYNSNRKMAFPGYESYGAPDIYAGYGAYAAVPYGAAAPPVVAGYGGEDLRTVFITGFPNDVKERELNNLLRFIPGYEASQMNWKNGQAGLNSQLQEHQLHTCRHSTARTHAILLHRCYSRHKGSPCSSMAVLHVLHVTR